MIKIYQLAQHYYVVKLEDYFENRNCFYLCLELHSDQTLYDYCLLNQTKSKKDKILDEKRVRELAIKIGQALEYLHDLGIILRNFCAKGILMTDVTKDRHLQTSIPRISKLDKAIILGYDQQTGGIFGDHRYRAPEVVSG